MTTEPTATTTDATTTTEPSVSTLPTTTTGPSADLLVALPSSLPEVRRAAILPAGFAAGAVAAGIKASGRPDLAVIRAIGDPASAAAVLTTNQVVAAPVQASRANLAATRPAATGGDRAADGNSGNRDAGDGNPAAASAADPAPAREADHFGRAGAIVATSGCANAATGLAGLADQVAIAGAVAVRFGVDPLAVLSLSTGVIGTRLPVDKVVAGVVSLAATGLTTGDDGLLAAAEALRTTDSVAKMATTQVDLAGPGGTPVTVTVSGIAKGVGMIHPRMATMLAVILTDAAVDPATLHGFLRASTVRTWNQLSVDGDTSTNDTVFLLASGASAAAAVLPGTPPAATLGSAVEAVARSLARQQAADGEGATTLLTCQVSGARDDVDARAVARAVVSSSLVKAAAHGRDPNWGRIAGAAGNARLGEARLLENAGLAHADACVRAGAPVALDPGALRIAIAGHLVYDGPAGGPATFDRAAVRAAMAGPEILLRLDLGLGAGTGEAFGCDLTEQYVIENAEYTT
jgi:glutamate N-acetyltransferase/amino-acid N-acetyltransferase